MDLILLDAVGFTAKALVVFLTVAAIVVILLRASRRQRFGGPRLLVKPLNDRFQALGDALRASVLETKDFKQSLKDRKKAEAAAPAKVQPRVFVLDFNGDIFASAVRSLREEVSAITAAAVAGDEVVVRLESPGGAVPHYGLAAAQLMRLKDKQVKVTVCVDRIAASGGYMMACVADKIVAAPFAIIGSIGVVAQVPNVHRLLKKFDVDFEEMTAGEFKRTVSMFGPITEKGRQKFQDQLEDTQVLFKDFVKTQRPKLDVDKVATGEYWLGTRAAELGLVDQLGTSDDYLIRRAADAKVFRVSFEGGLTIRDRFGRAAASVVDRAFVALIDRVMSLQLR
jgi:serine protease SohB